MAGVINVTSSNQAILTLGNSAVSAAPGAVNGFVVPLVQDVTVSATPGTVRYSTLDSTASSAFTTTNENEITFNMLVDDDAFFGNALVTDNTVATNGLLSTSIAKTEVFFSVAFEGTDTDDFYVKGKGFIGGLAPNASMESAVWISSGSLIINGELEKDQVS